MSLCSLVYLAEFAAVPRMMEQCSSTAMTVCSSGAATETAATTPAGASTTPANGGCCHHATPAGQKKQCPKKEQCPKQSKGCNAGADCCLNCPLCYVMLLPVAAEPTGIETGAREYGDWRGPYLYHYHASCWKPPNQA